MSKINDLKQKYKLNVKTFNKIVQNDFSPTKKYTEYMLSLRSRNVVTTDEIIDYVKKFDQLLPYIENKNIYDVSYRDKNFLRKTINNAETLKEEKTFNKTEHIEVLIENEKFILIRPKTHLGSLKYGAGTKWCTVSKYNQGTFLNYINNGVLAYVLLKNTNDKIAFYLKYQNSLSDTIYIYKSNDATCGENELIKMGFNMIEISTILLKIREIGFYESYEQGLVNKLTNTIKIVEKIDIETILDTIVKLEKINNKTNDELINNTKNVLTNFINILKSKI